MANTQALQILREALSKMADGDPRLTLQLERLVSLTNNTCVGQALVAGDEVLDDAGHTFSVTLPVGIFAIDATIMVDVVGGTPGTDGFTLAETEPSSVALLSAGSLAVLVFDNAGSVFGNPVPTPISYFDYLSRTIQVRGFIEVKSAGTFSLNVAQTGTPTSATLLAGSGLTASMLRGPQ